MAARRWISIHLVLLLSVVPAAVADTPERVYPSHPEDGAVTGARPVFHIVYEGGGDLSPREMRFRITLDPADANGARYVFDQRRRRNGWLVGGEQEVIYRGRKPLEDGEYRWRAEIWNGVEWSGGDEPFRLRIDSVPPADVEGLVMRLDDEANHVVLEWKPVSLDRRGRPEYVSRYHVYRYDRRWFPVGAKVHEIGVVVEPRFVDRELPESPSKILYYKVTAEDEAGNEPERPD